MDGGNLEKVANAVVIAHLLITDHDTESDRNDFPNLDRLATTRFPSAPPLPSFFRIVGCGGSRRSSHNLLAFVMLCRAHAAVLVTPNLTKHMMRNTIKISMASLP